MSWDDKPEFLTSADGQVHYTGELFIETIGGCMYLQDRSRDNAWIEGKAVPLGEWE